MQDFKRIGGEIISNPLNENFRKLRNDISIANTNLIFGSEDTTVNTINEMKALVDPVNGQWCYVISNGGLYRYATHDNEWHQIGDFGKTFRQGFLTSGLVLAEDKMTWNADHKSIHIPKMLVYFKNADGDEKYLMGMYQLGNFDFTIPSDMINNSYSLFINKDNVITYSIGLPTQDNISNIFIGSVVISSSTGWEDSLYTIPDMAYTNDRGYFIFNGGQVEGCILSGVKENIKVSRTSGILYDEGANFTIGQCENYPIDSAASNSYNIKELPAQENCELIYIYPTDSMKHDALKTNVLICGKYFNGNALVNVPEGKFTIQRYFISSNGENIISYGNTLYNSMTDATSHFNDLDAFAPNTFLYTEVSRIAISGSASDASNIDEVSFVNLTKLSTVGTIEPEYSDDEFLIYRGIDSSNPNKIKIDLDNLASNSTHNLEKLFPLGINTKRYYFFDTKKYINKDSTQTIIKDETLDRVVNGEFGYPIADEVDLDNLRNRINSIEEEIWKTPIANKELYEQGIRVREENLEYRADNLETRASGLENRTTLLENNKVNKTTTINGYKLGDNTNSSESKAINLVTDDIAETATPSNKWFTDERVTNSPSVLANTEHRNKKGTGIVSNSNPHGLSTDDITILDNSQKIFVTPNEERSIRSDRLPSNTIYKLSTLDINKMENIPISLINGNSASSTGEITNLGNFEKLRIYEDGVSLSLQENTYNKYIVGNSGLSKGNYYFTVDNINYSFTTTTLLNENDILDYRGNTLTQTCNGVSTTLAVTPNSSIGTALSFISYTDNNTLLMEIKGQFDESRVMLKSKYATMEALYPTLYTGYVDNAVNSVYAKNIHGMESAGASKYYGTNASGSVGVYNLPKYVTTATASDYTDIDQVTFVPVDLSVHLKHLGDSTITYASTEEETTLGTNLHDLVVNHFHKVLNNGTSSTGWDKINEWNFGNNLTVSVVDHKATINASSTGSSSVSSFVNLNDVNVVYTGNAGKLISVNSTENGLVLSDIPALDNYMLKTVYVDTNDVTKIKRAVLSDTATVATTATNALAVNNKVVDDTASSTGAIWTASKIISNTSSQIKSEGVNTYSGTTVPDSSLGKNGDLYILIES